MGVALGPPYAAILFASRGAERGMLGRVGSARRLSGAGLDVEVGLLAGRTVAVATPSEGPCDFDRAVAAISAAHGPTVFLAAGFAEGVSAAAPLGAVVRVGRVVGPGAPFRLSAPSWAPAAASWAPADGGVTAAPDASADVRAPWCYAFASCCAERSLPAALLVAIDARADAPSAPEVAAVERQPSVAGKLGAVLGSALRRPASVADLWRRRQERWGVEEALAEGLEGLVRAAVAPGTPSPG